MYQLYFKKETFEIKIEPLTVCANNVTDEPKRFNDCLFVCSDRKALRELVKEIKTTWVKELEEQLEKAKGIKVENKY